MALSPDVMLDVRLSAICSRNRYTKTPGPVIDELRAEAGVRTDILAMVAGTWAGFYDGPDTHPLAFALQGLPGARDWIELGQRRRGYVNHGSTPLPPTYGE
jgi:hypothetical protein